MIYGTEWLRDEQGNWWILRRDGAKLKAGTATCVGCGKEFGYRIRKGRAPARFCSRQCSAQHPELRWSQSEDGTWWYRQRNGEQSRGEERACPQCGKRFKVVLNWVRPDYPRTYCSIACANKAFHPKRGNRGENHYQWKGGRTLKDGYVYIRITDDANHRRYVLEHRHVMEQALGRPLRADETVHHKDGDKLNNQLTNLELRVGRHGVGATEPHCPTCTCFAH